MIFKLTVNGYPVLYDTREALLQWVEGYYVARAGYTQRAVNIWQKDGETVRIERVPNDDIRFDRDDYYLEANERRHVAPSGAARRAEDSALAPEGRDGSARREGASERDRALPLRMRIPGLASLFQRGSGS